MYFVERSSETDCGLKEGKDAFKYDNVVAQTLKDDLIKECWGNQNAFEF